MIWRTGSERRTISWVTIAVMVIIAYYVVQGINNYVITIPSIKFGFILMGILVALMWIPVFRWHAPSGQQSTLLGSARLGADREIAALETGIGDLLVGRAEKSGRLLRQDGPAHLVTIAPTRSGKGVGTILPNLLTLDRAIVCIDPKGENARVSARARGGFGQIHCLDPFGVSGRPTAHYNPLDRMDAGDIDLVDDVAALADAIVQDENAGGDATHWNEEARALLSGLILHIVATEPLGRRSLLTMREYLTLPPASFSALLTAMQANPAVHGLIARAANRFLGKADREASGVLSAAQRHTHFLDSPRIADCLGTSDFRFADLRGGSISIFLCLPPDRIDAYSRWLRLIVVEALTALARTPALAAQKPVLFLLDEFAALGRLEPVARAMGLMAGYGVQLWPILQDIHQLRHLYGERAGTFLANAGILQVFGVNDHDTADLVSKMIGEETVEYRSEGWTTNQGKDLFAGSTHGSSVSEHVTARRLFTPDEIMRLGPDRQLLLRPGHSPLLTGRIVYYRDREFAGLYDPA